MIVQYSSCILAQVGVYLNHSKGAANRKRGEPMTCKDWAELDRKTQKQLFAAAIAKAKRKGQ